MFLSLSLSGITHVSHLTKGLETSLQYTNTTERGVCAACGCIHDMMRLKALRTLETAGGE